MELSPSFGPSVVNSPRVPNLHKSDVVSQLLSVLVPPTHGARLPRHRGRHLITGGSVSRALPFAIKAIRRSLTFLVGFPMVIFVNVSADVPTMFLRRCPSGSPATLPVGLSRRRSRLRSRNPARLAFIQGADIEATGAGIEEVFSPFAPPACYQLHMRFPRLGRIDAPSRHLLVIFSHRRRAHRLPGAPSPGRLSPFFAGVGALTAALALTCECRANAVRMPCECRANAVRMPCECRVIDRR